MQSQDTLSASETHARDHLLSHCWPSGDRFCPRCSEKRHYTLSGGRYRCAACKYTFQDFSGRWINNGNLPPQVWMKVINAFVQGMTVHELAEFVGLSYNAAYKAVTTIRFAITAHAVDAHQMFGPEIGLATYLKNKKLTGIPPVKGSGPIPVFGIMERNGWVFIDLVSGMQAETVFHFNHSFHLSLIRTGAVLYTHRYRHYDALMLCGDDTLPYEYIRRYDRVADIEASPFWRFINPHLRRFKGISPRRFPLYVKELEFRFNHRNRDLSDMLTRYLCDLVPDFPDMPE